MQSNEKDVNMIQMLQEGSVRISTNQSEIRDIKFQLTQDNQQKSEDTTKVAREAVKKLVEKAEQEFVPTNYELQLLAMDMEREAKRNRVDKEMKVAKKIVDRKTK